MKSPLQYLFHPADDTIRLDQHTTVEGRRSYNKPRKNSNRFTFCKAPFNSLYFSWEGKVIACCFNQQFVLGNYPRQSIQEIWESEPSNKLRSALQNYDLSHGCDTCSLAVKNEQYTSVNALRFDWFPSGDFPSMMEFQLTNTCNLECEMCSGHLSSAIRANREKLPALPQLYDDNFVQQLKPFLPHLRYTTFSGGEPFLIKIYYDIWDEMIRINSPSIIKVITNGTIFNTRVKKILEQLSFDITLSLDGVTATTYEKIRKGSSFQLVMENMDAFHEHCKQANTPFNINFCPMVPNWHEIPDFVDFCNSRKIEFYFCLVDHPFHLSLLSLKGKQLNDIILELDTYTPAQQTGIEKKNAQNYRQFVQQLKIWNTE